MSDNTLDILIYIALTIGASAIGAIKSSKEKRRKAEAASRRPEPRPEVFTPVAEEEERGDFFDEIFGKRSEFSDREGEQYVPQPVIVEETYEEEIVPEAVRRKEAEAIAHFGKTDEERIQILMSDRKARKEMRDQRFADLFKLHENNMMDTDERQASDSDRFDIREAVIASEILNRKY